MEGPTARPWWRHDVLLAILGVVSVALVYWFEGASLAPLERRVVLAADLVLVVYFLADWILAWREAEDRRRYLWFNWWKLLGMVPLFVAALGFLRLLRLVRIVYVLALIPPIRVLFRNLRGIMHDGHVASLALVAGGLTIGGAVLVWLAERAANPRLEAFSEALWWAVVTVTTVGYGDITPVTRIGRFVAVLLMVTGIGTIGLLTSTVTRALMRQQDRQAAAVQGGPEGTPSLAGQLALLARLHKDKKLTDSEYAAAKRRVLED